MLITDLRTGFFEWEYINSCNSLSFSLKIHREKKEVSMLVWVGVVSGDARAPIAPPLESERKAKCINNTFSSHLLADFWHFGELCFGYLIPWLLCWIDKDILWLNRCSLIWGFERRLTGDLPDSVFFSWHLCTWVKWGLDRKPFMCIMHTFIHVLIQSQMKRFAHRLILTKEWATQKWLLLFIK